MKKVLLILGGGGHGRAVADIAEKLNRYEKIAFLDDKADKVSDYEVLGKTSDFIKFTDSAEFFVAVGNAAVREKLMCELKNGGAEIATLIHPSAVIGKNSVIGEGSVVMAGAVVGVDTAIARGVIINTCASVDHDNKIEDYVHIAVGAHLCGTVSVGKNTWIGAGATVINDVNICSGAYLGAGAVAIKDITESGTYVGVPAVKIK